MVKTVLKKDVGVWSDHDISLFDNTTTKGKDPYYCGLASRRFVQIVYDMFGEPTSKMTVLDVACMEGLHAIEFARQNNYFFSTGIDVREEHIEKANYVKDLLNLHNAKFDVGDARDLSCYKRNQFDIIVCAGFLYHLGESEVFKFIEDIYKITKGILILDTLYYQPPLKDKTTIRKHKNKYYHGLRVKEHPKGLTDEEKYYNRPRHSIDTEDVFWFTKNSLYYLLNNIGYTTVMECHIPCREEDLARVTMVAIKGKKRMTRSSPHVNYKGCKKPEEWIDNYNGKLEK